jgi:hypothetical protein
MGEVHLYLTPSFNSSSIEGLPKKKYVSDIKYICQLLNDNKAIIALCQMKHEA